MEVASHSVLTKDVDPLLYVISDKLFYPHESLDEVNRILTEKMPTLVYFL
jgi:hypothetical protein